MFLSLAVLTALLAWQYYRQTIEPSSTIPSTTLPSIDSSSVRSFKGFKRLKLYIVIPLLPLAQATPQANPGHMHQKPNLKAMTNIFGYQRCQMAN